MARGACVVVPTQKVANSRPIGGREIDPPAYLVRVAFSFSLAIGLLKQTTVSDLGKGGLLDLLCSRNARSRTPLVGRAQWETKQATLP